VKLGFEQRQTAEADMVLLSNDEDALRNFVYRFLALETALVRLIDNVESGSLESTNQAIHEAKQILSA
jgi:hypothetical protein